MNDIPGRLSSVEEEILKEFGERQGRDGLLGDGLHDGRLAGRLQ